MRHRLARAFLVAAAVGALGVAMPAAARPAENAPSEKAGGSTAAGPAAGKRSAPKSAAAAPTFPLKPVVLDVPSLAPYFDVRVSPVVDLYFLVRKLASGPEGDFRVKGMKEAVDAARRLESDLGSTSAWSFVDGAVVNCVTATDIENAFRGFPESYRIGAGKPFPFRQRALDLAAGLKGVEPEYMRNLWGGRTRRIQGGLDSLRTVFAPKLGPAFLHMTRSMGFQPPAHPLVVYVVSNAPAPQAFTRLDRSGAPVSFIGLEVNDGELLYEAMIHEAMHGLEALDPGRTNVVADLRARLEKAGLPANTIDNFAAVHTLMYVQAGETIRRTVDPHHVPFGESYGTYSREPVIAPIERSAWSAYLDGTLTREQALEEIVSGYVAARKTR